MKVLVTGGTGVIGSHLVARLVAEGASVTLLDDFNCFYETEIKRATLQGIGSTEGLPQRLRLRLGEPDSYIATNINGTFKILQAAKRAQVWRSETTTLSEQIEILERALRKKAIIEQLQEQMGDVPLTCADITKAKSPLGYNPKTKFSKGLPKFVQRHIEHKHLGASRG